MPNFKCAQFGACVLLIVLLTSLQLYVKDQTLETRFRRVRHAPLRIPSPVTEHNSTLCPKGRPKPKLDDILCMVHKYYVYYTLISNEHDSLTDTLIDTLLKYCRYGVKHYPINQLFAAVY